MPAWPTRTTESGAVVVCPEGRLCATTAPDLRAQLDALARDGSDRIVVDLSEVPAIDSSGLAALVFGLKAARQTGGDLRLVGPNERISMVLGLTNLNRVLTSFESADDAFDAPS